MHCFIKTIFITLVLNANLAFAQSFSFAGPTGTVTIPFGQTQYQATYYFTYYNIQDLFMPKMLIFLDGELLTTGMCEGADPFTPLEYTLNFLPGNHTVIFRLMSLTGVSNCIYAPLHHEEQFNIYCKFKVKMKNIFEYGIISVDNVDRDSPYDRPSDVNNQVSLGAKDQDYANYNRIWNTSGNNLSKWERQRNNGNWIFINSSRNFTYTIEYADKDKAIIQAGLRKNYAISRNDQTEFDGTISAGVVTHIVEQNSGQIQAPSTLPGTYYNYAGWEDNLSATNPRTIWPTNNETYMALYKYPHHSNTTTAYENPGQKRFIRSYGGHLHMVYESMNRVWYERSTNNGQTWEIMNGGKPIYGGIATHPSIDFYPGSNNVIIVYNKDEWEIAAQYYENGVFKCESIVSNSGWVNENSKPVIAWTYSRLMVAWNEMGSILYRLGQKISTPNHDFHWYFDPRVISDPLETDKNNPTIATSKLQAIGFWLAWDRNQSAIQFVNLDLIDLDEDIQQSVIYTYGQAGFSKNEQPSINVMLNNDYRISWFGSNGESKQVVTYFNNQFYIFGTTVSSHSMSATDDGKSIITYGDQNGTSNKFRQIWYFTLNKNLGTTGKQTHLSNGSSLSNMYAMSFQNATLPYSFSMSANLGSLPKVTETPISSGRKGIVVGDSAEFYFVLGDVTLNGNVIDYIPTGRNPDFSSIDTLNYFLSTEQFRLTNSSEFSFSIQYGVTDSLKAAEELEENEFVRFKLQLLNANTNQVLGEYRVVTFTNQNIIPYNTESFTINTNGLDNRRVRVRFVVEENTNGEYTMANIHADENVLPKENQNVISYSGSEIVTDYALEQNYPNPFNPTTTIKYQIPISGNVSFKVYDILGKEVANLVDEYLETGKYEVDFDASNLASGVYIYRLNVNDFVNVKKMVLLK